MVELLHVSHTPSFKVAEYLNDILQSIYRHWSLKKLQERTCAHSFLLCVAVSSLLFHSAAQSLQS